MTGGYIGVMEAASRGANEAGATCDRFHLPTARQMAWNPRQSMG